MAKATQKKTATTKSTKKNNLKKLNQTFQYDKSKLKKLAFVDFLLVLFSLKLCYCQAIGLINMTIPIAVVLTLSTLAFLGSLFVVFHPLRLALVTDETITIDHNHPLKWKDVAIAREFKVRYIYEQQAISLVLKEGVTYPLTFMQKLCQKNPFTPFSIPLYAMTPKDQDKIRKIIKQKVKYENTIK